MKLLLTLTTAMLALTACQPKTVNQYTVAPSGATTSAQGTGTNNVTTRTADGTVDGGGGKGVVCKDPSTGKETVEVLDLYEGEVVYGYKPKDFGSSNDINILREVMLKTTTHFNASSFADLYENQLEAAIEGTQKEFENYKSVVEFLSDQSKIQTQFLNERIALKETDDSLEPIVSNDCEIVQIAMFYNEDRLLISKPLWDKLNARSRAALFMHEMIYKQVRSEGVKNSKSTRKFIAAMFSSNVTVRPMQSREEDVTEDYLLCQIDPDSSFGLRGNFIIYNGVDKDLDPTSKDTFMLFSGLPGYTGLLRRVSYINGPRYEDIRKLSVQSKQNPIDTSKTPAIESKTYSILIESYFEDLARTSIPTQPLSLKFNSTGIHQLLNFPLTQTKSIDAVFKCRAMIDEIKAHKGAPFKVSKVSEVSEDEPKSEVQK